MARPVKEWVGSSPTAKIPDRVKLRIWEREEGRCHLSGAKINVGDKYQFDHKIALINGGKHCESNLAPALDSPHKIKTKADVKEKAKVARLRKTHLGITNPNNSF